jgi:hypothetical protein
MTKIFVSAIYKIYDTDYADVVWERLVVLASCINPYQLHLVCSPHHIEKAKNIQNVIPHAYEFTDLETYKVLCPCSGLPYVRKESKDTKEFMILMNAKTEFIQIVRNDGVLADHYIWLDAGISKIFKDPVGSLTKAVYDLSKPLCSNAIYIPGCTGPQRNMNTLIHTINWRFCGGFFVVPTEYVEVFFNAVLDACEEIKLTTGRAIWETNVWAYVEHRIPIHWEYGDHNEAIFSNIHNYGNSS